MKKNEHEYELFIDHIKNLQNTEINLDRKEIITNFQIYEIRESDNARKEIEYFTKLNYKNKNSCFCDKDKVKYFRLVDAQEDAEVYRQNIYVCDPINIYRIYHLTSKK